MLQKLPKEFGCWGIEPSESAELKTIAEQVEKDTIAIIEAAK